MSMDEIFSALGSCTMREGASQAAIRKLEQWIGKRLPAAYVELMKRSNGIEGFIAEKSYLVLWPVEQLAELNEAYSTAEFAPGLLLVGSDGAEMGYAFDTRHEPMPIKEVPFIGMSHEEAKPIAETVNGFLEHLKNR